MVFSIISLATGPVQARLTIVADSRCMKVMALIVGLLIGGLYIDSEFYNGRNFRAAQSLTHQVAAAFGLN